MHYARRKRLTLLLLVFLLIVILSVAGCSQTPQQGEPGGKAPAVITIWHSLQGAEAAALQEQTEELMVDHPEVIVELKYIQESKFAALAYQAEAGGEGPEIFIARWEILDEMWAQGSLAPVASTNTAGVDAASTMFRYGDKYYARPWLTDVPVLYYRTDLIKVPQNLNELIDSKETTVITSTSMSNLSTWWSAGGGKLYNNGRVTMDSATNREFLATMLVWQEKKTLVSTSDAFNTFVNGQAAYYVGWASQAQLLSQRKVPWKSIALTDLTGGTGQPLLGTTLGIANSTVKTTAEMTAAIKIVEDALLTPEVEAVMAQAGRRLPANATYYDLPQAETGVYPAAGKSLNSAWLLEGNSLERLLIPVQEKAWGKALNGQLSAEEALAEAQLQAQKILTDLP